MLQPWHDGERTLQQRVGALEKMAEIGSRVIRDHMPDQHRDFYEQLSYVALGAVDADGNPWATLRAGPPGFLRAPDAGTLRIALRRDPADPADRALGTHAALALLGIDLATRRRNRLSGRVRVRSSGRLEVTVQETFGNCPRYIHRRTVRPVRDPYSAAPEPARRLARLEGPARALVQAADSLFVASAAPRPEGGWRPDVSHRGGPPGFVEIGEDGALTVPDYPGNNFFSTLGNLVTHPRAGLAFVDFATGDLLQLTGGASLVLDGPEIAARPGAARLWRVAPEQILWRPGALPLRWTTVAEHEPTAAG